MHPRRRHHRADRATAVAEDDRSIYTLAGLNPPAEPAPIGAPGTPRDLRSSLDAIGQLTINWQCDNPRGSEGTMYEIHRRATADGTLEYLAVVGRKRFVDKTIPKGATAIAYQIRAVRSTSVAQQRRSTSSSVRMA